MQLSPHFSLDELIRTSTGLPNQPNAAIIENLKKLAQGLELVRTVCSNRPIRINSGYRSEELNIAIGGAKTSAHLTGYAADIVVSGLSTAEVCEAVAKAEIHYDQMINETSKGGQWVHISFAPAMRQQWLEFVNGKYQVHK